MIPCSYYIRGTIASFMSVIHNSYIIQGVFTEFYHFFTAIGAAYGTAKSGVGISAMAVMRPDLIMKSVIPVVMAGIVGIYGLVVSVVIANTCK